jgi:hypothetical protein
MCLRHPRPEPPKPSSNDISKDVNKVSIILKLLKFILFQNKNLAILAKEIIKHIPSICLPPTTYYHYPHHPHYPY